MLSFKNLGLLIFFLLSSSNDDSFLINDRLGNILRDEKVKFKTSDYSFEYYELLLNQIKNNIGNQVTNKIFLITASHSGEYVRNETIVIWQIASGSFMVSNHIYEDDKLEKREIIIDDFSLESLEKKLKTKYVGNFTEMECVKIDKENIGLYKYSRFNYVIFESFKDLSFFEDEVLKRKILENEKYYDKLILDK
jgi:hypothetical protein